MSLFLFITDINEFFETRTPPPPFFDHPFIKFNKYVRPPLPPPSPFILTPHLLGA